MTPSFHTVRRKQEWGTEQARELLQKNKAHVRRNRSVPGKVENTGLTRLPGARLDKIEKSAVPSHSIKESEK